MGEAARLTVRVTPRGGRDGVDGWETDAAGRRHLKVRVSAAAAEGAANAAAVEVIARALGVPRSRVRIVQGETARIKRLEIEGLDPAEAARILGGP